MALIGDLWDLVKKVDRLLDLEEKQSKAIAGGSPVNTFSAHNILLPDGSRTIPNSPALLADISPMTAVRRVLGMVFPYGTRGRSIVDLGCCDGGYTLEFAKMGMHALGIDARETNIENCSFVQKSFPNLRNLRFAKDDVRNIKKYGTFDVVFCCGLLYHLDNPIQYLLSLGELARYVVILNTHVALPEVKGDKLLSDMTTHEGVSGRWYSEWKSDSPTSEVEELRWASWGNFRSFWPTAAAIYSALQNAGFDMVFEQMDWLGTDLQTATAEWHYANMGRRMIVGIRTQQPRRGLVGSIKSATVRTRK